jgi:hypothetical protein
MIRVHVICEGQTEEMFINEVLAQAFHPLDINLTPALIGKPGHKGGNFRFERLLTDVEKRLLGDRQAYCTTFFDFYGLPEEFPGKVDAGSRNTMNEKAECLLEAMTGKLRQKLTMRLCADSFRMSRCTNLRGCSSVAPIDLQRESTSPPLKTSFCTYETNLIHQKPSTTAQ